MPSLWRIILDMKKHHEVSSSFKNINAQLPTQHTRSTHHNYEDVTLWCLLMDLGWSPQPNSFLYFYHPSTKDSNKGMLLTDSACNLEAHVIGSLCMTPLSKAIWKSKKFVVQFCREHRNRNAGLMFVASQSYPYINPLVLLLRLAQPVWLLQTCERLRSFTSFILSDSVMVALVFESSHAIRWWSWRLWCDPQYTRYLFYVHLRGFVLCWLYNAALTFSSFPHQSPQVQICFFFGKNFVSSRILFRYNLLMLQECVCPRFVVVFRL